MLEKVFKRQIYYIASIVFIVLGLGYFAACLTQPFIGLGLKNINGQWLVTTANPYGEGYRSGIQVGDEILKINGVNAGGHRSVHKWEEAEGASTVEFRKPDELTAQTVTISKQPALLMVFSEAPLVILGFTFWFLGFMTWYKRPFLEQARTLFWMNWIIGLAIVLAHASSRCLLLAKELESITFSLVPVFLIAFISVFPAYNQNKINKISYKITIILFLTILGLLFLHSLGIVHLVSLIRRLMLFNMIIGILSTLWNLGLLIKLPKDHPKKNEVGIILLGIGIGFLPFVLLTAFPIILNFEQLLYTQVSSLFVAAVPVSLYYIIVNKYLPDSRRLYETALSYIGAAAILSLVVFLALFFLQIVPTIYFEIYSALLLFTLLSILCFHFIRIGINRLWERSRFSQDKQAFKQKMAALNENLSSLLAEDRILDELINSLGIDGIFMIMENAQIGCLKKAAGRFKENPRELEMLENFFYQNQRLDLEAKMLPDDCPAGIYVPFIAQDSTCGIFFGRRSSRIKFEQSELPFLTLLAGQLQYQIIMSLVIGELTKEIHFLTKSSGRSQRRKMELQGITNALFRKDEQKRKLLTDEICAGPLQWSMDLSRWLKYLKTECPADDKTLKVISYLQERAEDLNYELNGIVNAWGPPILTHLGLVPAVQWLCQKIMTEELSLISLKISGLDHQSRLKEDVEVTAYRFLQEGIMNSVRHSGSNMQTVHIALNETGLELTVSDSGRGFDADQIENWLLTGTHFGLAEMKERIDSLDGELQIISGINRGTTLKALIPVL
ncbi:signal transduction histidine kinase [Desulfitobacterium dehalogenans ATCC 51507]|uniref:histidine kinase n=1 Tax=Desulfitobacterium dehalogenans (strain ATCC 51507 / DSM 9161 / JW/IU-DC1) TaxID=756499 RepID=I4A3P6_DESDJ|nr:ATP-binding protein [Desulfitobacterium dehalogenans]AFL98580.1 signal transduction histidine kinase [Desulfitobacterium dehalogenans ATCC 51507]